MSSARYANPLLLLSRVLLAAIFIASGFGKIGNVAGTMAYMEASGVPGLLVWPTIAVEVLGGLAVLAGFQTRVAAFLLAGFTLLTALMIHNHLADQAQFIQFMKNLAIAGGFLSLMVSGAGAWSVDGRTGKGAAIS